MSKKKQTADTTRPTRPPQNQGRNLTRRCQNAGLKIVHLHFFAALDLSSDRPFSTKKFSLELISSIRVFLLRKLILRHAVGGNLGAGFCVNAAAGRVKAPVLGQRRRRSGAESLFVINFGYTPIRAAAAKHETPAPRGAPGLGDRWPPLFAPELAEGRGSSTRRFVRFAKSSKFRCAVLAHRLPWEICTWDSNE